jgi:hypothetical protein
MTARLARLGCSVPAAGQHASRARRTVASTLGMVIPPWPGLFSHRYGRLTPPLSHAYRHLIDGMG